MVEELIQYIRIAESQCLYRSTNLGIQIYNTFLHSLVEAKEVSISVLDALSYIYVCESTDNRFSFLFRVMRQLRYSRK